MRSTPKHDSNGSLTSFELTLPSQHSSVSLLSMTSLSSLDSSAAERKETMRSRRRTTVRKNRWLAGNHSPCSGTKNRAGAAVKAPAVPKRQSSNPFLLLKDEDQHRTHTAPKAPRRKHSNPNLFLMDEAAADSDSESTVMQDNSARKGDATGALKAHSSKFDALGDFPSDEFNVMDDFLSSLPPPPPPLTTKASPTNKPVHAPPRQESFLELRNAFSSARV